MALSKDQMREYMRKKRSVEKMAGEQYDDRTGRLDASEAPVTIEAPVPIEPMTATDREFELARPGYYIFGEEVKERECWKCGIKYETRMDMNKFCGPKCKEEWLTGAFGKLRVPATK